MARKRFQERDGCAVPGCENPVRIIEPHDGFAFFGTCCEDHRDDEQVECRRFSCRNLVKDDRDYCPECRAEINERKREVGR